MSVFNRLHRLRLGLLAACVFACFGVGLAGCFGGPTSDLPSDVTSGGGDGGVAAGTTGGDEATNGAPMTPDEDAGPRPGGFDGGVMLDGGSAAGDAGDAGLACSDAGDAACGTTLDAASRDASVGDASVGDAGVGDAGP